MDVAWVHAVDLDEAEAASQGDAVIGLRLTAGGDLDEVIIYAAAGPAFGELSQYVYAVDEISIVSPVAASSAMPAASPFPCSRCGNWAPWRASLDLCWTS